MKKIYNPVLMEWDGRTQKKRMHRIRHILFSISFRQGLRLTSGEYKY